MKRALVVLVGVVFGVLVYLLIGFILPVLHVDYSGPGRVEYDENGIITVRGSNNRELGYGLGWITARERSWQLEIMRLAASSRVESLIGKSGREIDNQNRPVNYQLRVEEISSDAREYLEAFAEGVNNFWKEHPNRLGGEFWLLRHRPEPWKAEDSLLIMRLLAWTLSTNYDVEPWNMDLFRFLGNQTEKFKPRWINRGAHHAAYDGKDALIPNRVEYDDLLGLNLPKLGDGLSKESPKGSNAWAVSSEAREGKGALVCGDPHLHLSMPGAWMLVRLETPEFSVMGAMDPGIPAVLLGSTPNLAWAVTMGYVDQQDLVLVPKEEIVFQKRKILSARFFGWLPKEEIIEEFASHPLGPVVGSNEKFAYVLRWSIYEKGARLEPMGFLEAYKTKTVEGFAQAMAPHLVAPTANFVIATAEGQVGHYLGGWLPRRKNSGLVPTRSWENWDGYYPPVVFSKEPYVVSANQGILTGAPGMMFGSDFAGPSRAIQIHKFLEKNSATASLADYLKFQVDDHSLFGEELVPLLKQILGETEIGSLATWDFRLERKSKAAAQFSNWWKTFLLELARSHGLTEEFSKELISDGLIKYGVLEIFREKIAKKDAAFIEIVKNSWAESLKTYHGEKWEDVHKVHFGHALSDLTFGFLDIGPEPSDGSGDVVNATGATDGPSFRMCVEYDAQGNRAGKMILPNGNSGHVFSGRYRNWWERFKKNDGFDVY